MICRLYRKNRRSRCHEEKCYRLIMTKMIVMVVMVIRGVVTKVMVMVTGQTMFMVMVMGWMDDDTGKMSQENR